MKKLITYQIDSFTKELFKGNPAGVVLNADNLTEKQMQLIAREMNNSETAFLFSPNDENSDGGIRYFTPEKEVPTCGHATIGAMYAKALEENLESCVLKYETKIGVLPFEIIKMNGDYQVVMTQGHFELAAPFEAKIKNKIIGAIGLTDSDLHEKCPVQIASTGHSKVMIGIKSREKLNSLTPDLSALTELSKIINCNGYFIFTFDSNDAMILTYGRMFAPAIGVKEDPVTGNANGPLGGYLVHNRLVEVKDEIFEFRGRQGEQINRLGTVVVRVHVQNGKADKIQIRGKAVVVFRTEMEI